MTSSDKRVTVAQGDREAAKRFDPLLWEEHPHGEDFQSLIQAFARHRQSAQADAVEIVREAVEALAPFAKLGEMANFAFAPALFADHQSLKDLPWSEDGKPVTATFGDVRRALQVYATLTDFLARGDG